MIISHLCNWLRRLVVKKKLASCGRNVSIGKDYILKGPHNIYIGDNFSAGTKCYLQAWDRYLNKNYEPQLIIGNNVAMMSNCQISCIDKISIGDGVLMGDNVFVTDNFHGNTVKENLIIPPLKRELYSKGPVIIGNNVWIGRNVCIMPGVIIGDGAIIGANSVVTSNIKPKSVVGGIPAKELKK